MPFVALQLDMLAGLDLKEVWSMCSRSVGADALKLRCLCLPFMSHFGEIQDSASDKAEGELALHGKRKRKSYDTDCMAERGPLFRKLSQVRCLWDSKFLPFFKHTADH